MESGSKQYLVRVSDEFMITGQLAEKANPKKFTIGNNVFHKAAYRLI